MTFVDSRVIELAEQFVPVKIDAEKDRSTAKKYKVRSYPTIIFTDSKGKPVAKIRSFMKPERFAAKMQEVVTLHRELSSMEVQYETDPSDWATAGKLAAAHADRGNNSLARKLIKAVEAVDAANEKGHLTRAYMSMGDFYVDEKEDQRSAIKWYGKVVDTGQDQVVVADARFRIASAHFESRTKHKVKSKTFARKLKNAEQAINDLLAMPTLSEELKKQTEDLLESVKKDLQEHEELRKK